MSTTRRARIIRAALAVALGAVVLTGCTSPKDVLGTNASPCFRALPVAKDAVDGAGDFAGVRYLSPKQLVSILDAPSQPASLRAEVKLEKSAVCAVAYQGSYVTAAVSRGISNGPTGTLALVVVAAKKNTVTETVIMKRAPLRLRRVFPELH